MALRSGLQLYYWWHLPPSTAHKSSLPPPSEPGLHPCRDLLSRLQVEQPPGLEDWCWAGEQREVRLGDTGAGSEQWPQRKPAVGNLWADSWTRTQPGRGEQPCLGWISVLQLLGNVSHGAFVKRVGVSRHSTPRICQLISTSPVPLRLRHPDFIAEK